MKQPLGKAHPTFLARLADAIEPIELLGGVLKTETLAFSQLLERLLDHFHACGALFRTLIKRAHAINIGPVFFDLACQYL